MLYLTKSMSSRFVKTTKGGRGPNLILKKLVASTNYIVGEVMKGYDQDTNEVLAGVAATPILGWLVGIVDKYGNAFPVTTVTAGTASSTVTTTVDTGTTITYYGLVDVSPSSVYSMTVSGTLGTTNESDYAGARIDIDSANTTENQLLETTATRTIGTPANMYSHGKDPADATRLLVSLAMSEIDGVKE